MSRNYLHKVEGNDGEKVELIGMIFTANYAIESVERNTMISVFEKHGLPTKFLAPIKRKNAFLRALRSYERAKESETQLVHWIGEKDGIISFQFDRKVVDETLPADEQTAKFLTESVIRYIIEDDRIICDNPEIYRLVQQKLGWCSENYSKVDFSKFINDTFLYAGKKRGALNIRRAGGMYFVPAPEIPYLEKVEAAVRELDPNGHFNIVEVPALPRSKKTVADSKDLEMEGYLEDLEKKIQARLIKNEDGMTERVANNELAENSEQALALEFWADLTEKKLLRAKLALTRHRMMVLSQLKLGENNPSEFISKVPEAVIQGMPGMAEIKNTFDKVQKLEIAVKLEQQLISDGKDPDIDDELKNLIADL